MANLLWIQKKKEMGVGPHCFDTASPVSTAPGWGDWSARRFVLLLAPFVPLRGCSARRGYGVVFLSGWWVCWITKTKCVRGANGFSPVRKTGEGMGLTSFLFDIPKLDLVNLITMYELEMVQIFGNRMPKWLLTHFPFKRWYNETTYLYGYCPNLPQIKWDTWLMRNALPYRLIKIQHSPVSNEASHSRWGLFRQWPSICFQGRSMPMAERKESHQPIIIKCNVPYSTTLFPLRQWASFLRRRKNNRQ